MPLTAPITTLALHDALPISNSLPGLDIAGILSLPPQEARGQRMKREYHRWHSPRLGIELGVVVYGHWGPPLRSEETSELQSRENLVCRLLLEKKNWPHCTSY